MPAIRTRGTLDRFLSERNCRVVCNGFEIMICPLCKEAMIVVEHERIELDYCVECHGVWFDAGELALMLKSLALPATQFSMDHIMALEEENVAEKKRRCPLCRKKMKKVMIGQDPRVLIDACPDGEGLWFDGGEVGQIIGQLVDTVSDQSDTEGRVVTFLGETFKASG